MDLISISHYRNAIYGLDARFASAPLLPKREMGELAG